MLKHLSSFFRYLANRIDYAVDNISILKPKLKIWPDKNYLAETLNKLVVIQSHRLVEFLDIKRAILQTIDNEDLSKDDKLAIINRLVGGNEERLANWLEKKNKKTKHD